MFKSRAFTRSKNFTDATQTLSCQKYFSGKGSSNGKILPPIESALSNLKRFVVCQIINHKIPAEYFLHLVNLNFYLKESANSHRFTFSHFILGRAIQKYICLYLKKRFNLLRFVQYTPLSSQMPHWERLLQDKNYISFQQENWWYRKKPCDSISILDGWTSFTKDVKLLYHAQLQSVLVFWNGQGFLLLYYQKKELYLCNFYP